MLSQTLVKIKPNTTELNQKAYYEERKTDFIYVKIPETFIMKLCNEFWSVLAPC